MSTWRNDAECLSIGTELFFPEKGGIAPYQVRQAKDICARCPVTAECLDLAMSVEMAGFQRFGIFGGMTAKERYDLHRKQMGRAS